MVIKTEILDNVILSEDIKDGFYEIEIVKKRSADQHKFYWWLMKFFAENCRIELKIENHDDAHNFFKYRLGDKVYNKKGVLINMVPKSIKYANMTQSEFNEFFIYMKDIVGYELGIDVDQMKREFDEYCDEQRNKRNLTNNKRK